MTAFFLLTMTEALEDMEKLIVELEKIKALAEATEQREKTCKADILALMEELGMDSHETDKGKVRKQVKTKKIYGETVKKAEEAFKQAKSDADTIGDFEESPSTPIIVFNKA